MYGGFEADDLDGGSGNDVLVGGAGSDRLVGGAGSDRFGFDSTAHGRDRITDFTRGAGNDVLDISDVLSGSTVTSSNAAHFVRFSESGGKTFFSVDADGSTGGASFIELAVLQNLTGVLLHDMLSQGNLVVA